MSGFVHRVDCPLAVLGTDRGYHLTMRRLVCVGCGARSKIRVVYGLPGPELLEEASRGEVALGGCMPFAPPPAWLCEDCEGDESKRALLEQVR